MVNMLYVASRSFGFGISALLAYKLKEYISDKVLYLLHHFAFRFLANFKFFKYFSANL